MDNSPERCQSQQPLNISYASHFLFGRLTIQHVVEILAQAVLSAVNQSHGSKIVHFQDANGVNIVKMQWLKQTYGSAICKNIVKHLWILNIFTK